MLRSRCKLHRCDFSKGDAWLLELLKVRVRVTGVIVLPRSPPTRQDPCDLLWQVTRVLRANRLRGRGVHQGVLCSLSMTLKRPFLSTP